MEQIMMRKTGITGNVSKCVYYMLTLISGVAAALILQRFGVKVSFGAYNLKGLSLAASEIIMVGLGFMALSVVMLVIVPLIAFTDIEEDSVSDTIFGTACCLTTGCFQGFLMRGSMVLECLAALVIVAISSVAVAVFGGSSK